MYDFDPDAILPRGHYDQHPHELAVDLLGRHLVRETEEGLVAGRIVELEVYGHDRDPASHCDSGEPTDRTRSMFGEAGTAYVYTIYGMYQCLNVVAPAGDRASALLVRALEPLMGLPEMAERRGIDAAEPLTRSQEKKLLSGPGKLCQAFDIDCALDGVWLDRPQLCITRGEPVSASRVERTARIGLNPKTVGESAEWDWRYVVSDSEYLSR